MELHRSIFCPVFISEEAPPPFFLMTFVVDLSELWLLCTVNNHSSMLEAISFTQVEGTSLALGSWP